MISSHFTKACPELAEGDKLIMNYALHRSEIGEVWIQPSLLKEAPKLFLVPSPDLKFKTASGIGCKFCDAFYNGYCSKYLCKINYILSPKIVKNFFEVIS